VKRKEALSKVNHDGEGKIAFNVDSEGNESIVVVNGKNVTPFIQADTKLDMSFVDKMLESNTPTEVQGMIDSDTNIPKEDKIAIVDYLRSKEDAMEKSTPSEELLSNRSIVEKNTTKDSFKEEGVRNMKNAKKESTKTEEPISKHGGVLGSVRDEIAKIDEELYAELNSVADMIVV